jgi:SGNH hydrolase-like domain, acetyltransferase AlgX
MPVTAKNARLYNLLTVTSMLITSSLVALVLLESMVRVLFPIYDPSGQVDFVVGPNGLKLGPTNQTLRQHKNTGDYNVAVHFSSRGFRDAKDVATARSGDIVVVGDSIAFGWGVEESQRFSNVLQTLLQRRVFNIAIPGDNFAGYDNLLKYAESLGAQIDDVVIAVSMETDLLPYSAPNQPAPPSEAKVAASRRMETLHLGLAREDIKLWLSRNSAAYVMFTTAVQQTPWLKKVAVRANLLVPNLVGIPKNTYSSRIIKDSANRLAEIARRYRHAVILIVPSRALWVGDNRPVEDLVHREFVAALRARHLDVIDLRSTFESGGDPLSHHFRNDGHWNPTGHRLAAASLATQESDLGQPKP